LAKEEIKPSQSPEEHYQKDVPPKGALDRINALEKLSINEAER
jgi:hypothetical protein